MSDFLDRIKEDRLDKFTTLRATWFTFNVIIISACFLLSIILFMRYKNSMKNMA